MKISDIKQNIDSTLNLKKDKSIFKVSEIGKNIETIKKERKIKNINIRNGKEISVNKIKNKKTKDISKIFLKNRLNLKKEIKKQIQFRKLINKINIYIKVKEREKTIFKLSAFLVLLFSFILLNKIIVESLVISGINNLYKSSNARNIESIETNLSKAKTKFNIAGIFFIPFSIIPEKNLQNAKYGIKSLKEITKIGLEGIDLYYKSNKFIEGKNIEEIYFTNLMENLKPFFIETESRLYKTKNYLSKIEIDKNNNYSKQIIGAKKITNEILDKISYINKNYEIILDLLGKGKRKNYFIVLQNNDEIRPTGGFMGSAGIIGIFEGQIKKLEKKDIYAYEWDVNKNYTEQIQAPTGVKILSSRLGLRDSNAYVDFQTSAKSINYFMKKGGYDIDGIIFVNQKPVIEILEKIGGVEFGKYNSIITSKNFSEVMSLLVEAKVSKKSTLDTPKQVLFDFALILKEKIIKNNQYKNIAKILIENIESRDLAFISFTKEENELLDKLKISGKFDYEKYTDFNYPFYISVGGNKSDKYIKKTYNKYINIDKKKNGLCELKTNLKIDVKNDFSKEDENRIVGLMEKFRIKPNTDLINISGKGENKSYTKVIIPKNSQINKNELKINGYSIIDHGYYKTIEKLINTKPGEKKYFQISYIIKEINCKEHNYKIYKQAGIYKYDLKVNYNNTDINSKKEINAIGLNKDFDYNFK